MLRKRGHYIYHKTLVIQLFIACMGACMCACTRCVNYSKLDNHLYFTPYNLFLRPYTYVRTYTNSLTQLNKNIAHINT